MCTLTKNYTRKLPLQSGNLICGAQISDPRNNPTTPSLTARKLLVQARLTLDATPTSSDILHYQSLLFSVQSLNFRNEMLGLILCTVSIALRTKANHKMSRTSLTSSAEAHLIPISDVTDDIISSPSDQEGPEGSSEGQGADSSHKEASDSLGSGPMAAKSPTDFSQLPLERQRQIWKHCLPPGKIISLFYYYTIIRLGTPAPIGLRINRESRPETLRHYKVLLPTTH